MTLIRNACFQENECYQDELKRSQRQFLQVSRDKNFLLERLLQFENVDSTTSDSEGTDSSDSGAETKPKAEQSSNKR